MIIPKKHFQALLQLNNDDTNTEGSNIKSINYLLSNRLVERILTVGQTTPSYIINPLGNSVIKDKTNLV